MSETPRAQLIHIDVDRRLGHEWDEWDGRPLPNRGNYDSSPTLFFGWSAAALAAALAVGAIGLFLLGPRLALAGKGRALISVNVELHDESGAHVLSASVEWFIATAPAGL